MKNAINSLFKFEKRYFDFQKLIYAPRAFFIMFLLIISFAVYTFSSLQFTLDNFFKVIFFSLFIQFFYFTLIVCAVMQKVNDSRPKDDVKFKARRILDHKTDNGLS